MISLILLSGGKGLRAGGKTPKQYTMLSEKPLILHTLTPFLHIPEITEIVIVCEKEYQTIFKGLNSVSFALPGKERHLSVKNGFMSLSGKNKEVLVHDGARPFVKKSSILKLVEAGRKTGAATLANKARCTIKRSSGNLVEKTLNREELWEIQTPQYLRYDLMKKGIQQAEKENAFVTDDVSFAELIDHPVELVESCSSNFKVTTASDLEIARALV